MWKEYTLRLKRGVDVMDMTEDRVRVIVLNCMLAGLRTRQRAAVGYISDEDMLREARLLSAEIKALEECRGDIYQRMDSF